VAWPAFGPYVMPYIPRLGENRVAVTQVSPGDKGTWDIAVSYYYNNRPANARLYVKLMGADGKEYQVAGGTAVYAAPGSNVLRIHAGRPFNKEAIKATQVIVELKVPGQPQAVVSGSTQAKVEWADWKTHSIAQEAFGYPPDLVPRRAAALAAKGDVESMIRAKGVL